MADEMRAAYVRRLGGPAEIQVGTLPVPRPGPTDVLVQVQAVAADPVDTLVRSGAFPTHTPFPFVVGRDLVGRVVARGPGVSGLDDGAPVWCNSMGHGGRQGSFAEYAAVPADRLYALPTGVDPQQAVAVAHPGATAYLALFRHTRVRPGDVVYIGGAGGNVGSAGVQLAARAGARVLASARPEQEPGCRADGAAEVLDYRDPLLYERIRGVAPAGVAVFWDTSGHAAVADALDVLAPRGRILVTAARAGDADRLPVNALYRADVTVEGFVISNATAAELAEAAGVLSHLLAEGRLHTHVTEVLPLDRTAEVHTRLESGDVRGRIVLRP